MNWQSVDNVHKVEKFDLEFEKENANLKSVIFKRDGQPVLKIAHDGYSSITVFVPKKPDPVKRHKLHGKALDLFVICEYFEYAHDATEKLTEYADKANCERDRIGLQIDEVNVILYDDGTINEV